MFTNLAHITSLRFPPEVVPLATSELGKTGCVTSSLRNRRIIYPHILVCAAQTGTERQQVLYHFVAIIYPIEATLSNPHLESRTEIWKHEASKSRSHIATRALS